MEGLGTGLRVGSMVNPDIIRVTRKMQMVMPKMTFDIRQERMGKMTIKSIFII